MKLGISQICFISLKLAAPYQFLSMNDTEYRRHLTLAVPQQCQEAHRELRDGTKKRTGNNTLGRSHGRAVFAPWGHTNIDWRRAGVPRRSVILFNNCDDANTETYIGVEGRLADTAERRCVLLLKWPLLSSRRQDKRIQP